MKFFTTIQNQRLKRAHARRIGPVLVTQSSSRSGPYNRPLALELLG